MRFEITMDCDNAAFDFAPGYEIATILERMIDRLRMANVKPGWSMTLRDTNGNTVGKAVLID